MSAMPSIATDSVRHIELSRSAAADIRRFKRAARCEPNSRASIDAVATRSDHAFRVERFLDRRAGLLEGWHGLREMQVVIIERRAADEHAAFGDLLRHPAVAGVRPRPLVRILAIKRDDVQPARKARRADIHYRVVEAVILVDVATQLLDFVGDLAVHRRAWQEPDVAAARTPFQQAEF